MEELPRVILHNAVSLDSRLDWFMPDVELYYGLAGRWKEDLTLVGSDTILNAPDTIPEDEKEDYRPEKPEKPEPDDERPILAVCDSGGRVKTWHYWRDLPYWRDAIALCSKKTPTEHIRYLDELHIKHITSGEDRVNLHQVLKKLKEDYDVNIVRVDSGGKLNGVLLRAGLVDEISLLVHPCLIGGVTPRGFFNADDLDSPEGIVHLELKHFEKMEDDIIWLKYAVIKEQQQI